MIVGMVGRNVARRVACLALLIGAATAGVHAQKAADMAGSLVRPESSTLETRSPDARRLDALLNDAWKINLVADAPKAQAAFEQIRIEAERLGLTRQVAGALHGLATIESNLERNQTAKPLLERALHLYRLAGDEVGEARSERALASLIGLAGDRARAVAMLWHARDTFKRLDLKWDLALTYHHLVYQTDIEIREGLMEEALAAAREGGERWVECSMHHSLGDAFFNKGDYTGAFQALTTALACYETTDHISDKGRVLISLGRIQRAHGQFERALSLYKQAYALQQQVHDEPAALQSLNAIGVAYGYLGRFDEARQCYEEALSRSQAMGSERYVAFLLGALGSVYVNLGRYEKAIELLQQSLSLEKGPARIYRYNELANALAFLGRFDEAMVAADQAVALSREDSSMRVTTLATRASITQHMNRLEASDNDMSEALTLIEDLRAKALPQDIMKRSFTDTNQQWFGMAIEIRSRRGDIRGSLQIAEQARSRAFLDLLASRHVEKAAAGPLDATHAMTPQNGLPAALLGATDAPPVTTLAATTARDALPTRGAAAAPADIIAPYMPALAADVDSPLSARAPTIDEMIATAVRLRSTMLIYWVGTHATLAWVISPTGEVHEATVNVELARLSELTRATTSLLKDGGAALTFAGPSQTQPWRDLYQLLIKPVRAHLPTTPGSLVTVVPHGPLYQLSFAALQDDAGRYLIESYRLHYTPSVGVLAYTTAEGRHRPASPDAKALLIGDPSAPASDPSDGALAALPWARREVTEIGTLIGAKRARVITEGEATEGRVREEIEEADLLHFATHGVIRQNESMSSFLALSSPGRSSPAASAGKIGSDADGKLTADEVYGLRLHADLVVLSACGTALGPMTGDGVIGFTRAFLYAGARSVIATEWNVPDQTGYEVMRRFYRSRKGSHDTSDALREAQLEVLSSLRSGKLRVDTPGGTVALRENPLFWAGFVLVGRP
jgi:CHAT domain-containing protein/tetratricopeptide (TPR) repeat protein